MILPKPITAAMVDTVATAYYTADPALKRAIIKSLSFHNSDAAAQTITVYLVPAGDAADATNQLTATRSLLPDETWEVPEAVNKTLLGGGMIQAVASVANKINIQGTVLEYSA